MVINRSFFECYIEGFIPEKAKVVKVVGIPAYTTAVS